MIENFENVFNDILNFSKRKNVILSKHTICYIGENCVT
jgi:hypothetical protein